MTLRDYPPTTRGHETMNVLIHRLPHLLLIRHVHTILLAYPPIPQCPTTKEVIINHRPTPEVSLRQRYAKRQALSIQMLARGAAQEIVTIVTREERRERTTLYERWI